MTISTLEIISIILAGVAVGGSFVPRFPACIPAWLGLLCMHISGAPYVDSKVLIFWGIASIIVLMLGILQPKSLTGARQGHAYVVGATIVGVILGYLISPVSAAIILGGAVGAFFGALAFMRTPAGPRFPVASSEFLQYLCAKGLPAVISCAMAAIVIATAL